MTVSKSKLFYSLLSMHSALVACTALALAYAASLAPWNEPLLYVTIFALFWAYYYFGDVLEVRVYCNDSAMQHRLLADIPSALAYYPTPYLCNANCQTLFAAIGRPPPNVRFERELVVGVYPDGEVCRLDWSMAPSKGKPSSSASSFSPSSSSDSAGAAAGAASGPSSSTSSTNSAGGGGGGPSSPNDDVPVVIVFHGLTGGSDDQNMHYLTQSINRIGWHVVIPVRRGCGEDTLTTVPKYYAYGGLEDTEYVVEYIARKMSGHTILGVGISAGSNILANYLGVYGKSSRIRGAISVANGYCWDKGTQAIREHHPVWDAIMSGIVLHTLFRRHDIFRQRHNECVVVNTKVVAPTSPVKLQLKRAGSQREVDEVLSRRLHGFESLHAFYREQSCEYRLDNIAVPTIFLNALDDPLAHHLNIPVDKLGRNPNTLLVTTACGGHLGWAEGWWPFRDRPTWMERFVVEALQSLNSLVEERRHDMCVGTLRGGGGGGGHLRQSLLRRRYDAGEDDDESETGGAGDAGATAPPRKPPRSTTTADVSGRGEGRGLVLRTGSGGSTESLSSNSLTLSPMKPSIRLR